MDIIAERKTKEKTKEKEKEILIFYSKILKLKYNFLRVSMLFNESI